MRAYTFDEICDSQQFEHDQEFVKIETARALESALADERTAKTVLEEKLREKP